MKSLGPRQKHSGMTAILYSINWRVEAWFFNIIDFQIAIFFV